MMNLLLITIGGALGTLGRYASSEFILKLLRGTNCAYFPWHTLAINVVGSLLAGILYYFAVYNFNEFDPKLKNFLLIGFLGGFTTFSSFSLDFFRLFTAGHEALAFTYAFASVSLALLFVFFGFYLMKIVFI